jgi:hypothetical protein
MVKNLLHKAAPPQLLHHPLDVATLSATLPYPVSSLACCSCYCTLPIPLDLMDALSVAASIVTVLQLTAAVINYLNDVKDAPKDCVRFAIEAANLYNLLVQLKFRLEEGKCNEAWYTTVRALGVENGPLDQYKHALENLRVKITNGRGLKKIGNALAWIFSKEEAMSIISRVERLKSLIQIALEMDHL